MQMVIIIIIKIIIREFPYLPLWLYKNDDNKEVQKDYAPAIVIHHDDRHHVCSCLTSPHCWSFSAILFPLLLLLQLLLLLKLFLFFVIKL